MGTPVGLLRPYQRDENTKVVTTDQTVDADDTAVSDETGAPTRRGQTPKKGRPTRTRAEAEAERLARLHPNLSKKEQRRAAAAARAENRTERFQKQQNTPERVLMRDYVDSRWTITEFLLPVMLVMVATSFLFSRHVLVQTIIMFVMVALLVGWIGNVWLFWRGYKREAHQRIKDPQFRGVLMEMNSRMMNIRRFRNPGARIPRGGEY